MMHHASYNLCSVLDIKLRDSFNKCRYLIIDLRSMSLIKK